MHEVFVFMMPLWKSALLSSTLAFVALAAPAQNATSGGDQRPQQDAQGMRGPGGGRRGGATRGTVTAVSGSSITLKDENGTSWTVITTDNTRVMRGREPLPIASIQAGDEVFSMGMPDAEKHELHAMMVMDVPAAEVAKAKANLGKTYIVGKITAIDDVKLTILRSDKVSQTIQLDESTSLRKGGRMDPAALQAAGLDAGMMGFGGGMGPRGAGAGDRQGQGYAAHRNNGGTPPDPAGESITLADVKVGDTVVGLGSVKGGIFVPTDLRVQSPRGMGADRRSGGAQDVPQQQ